MPRSSFVACALLGFLASACSSSSSSSSPASTPDAGDASNPNDASSGADSGGGTSFSSCDGACATTTLTVTFGGKSEPLTRAQFGFVKGDGGATILHLEAHDGGSPACPTQSSPSPDRTLVVEDLPLPKDATPLGSGDGVRAAFFDFKGTLLPSTPLAKATNVTLKPTAAMFDGTTLSKLALDVDMTFPQGGTLTGHLFAEHCASMDE